MLTRSSRWSGNSPSTSGPHTRRSPRPSRKLRQALFCEHPKLFGHVVEHGGPDGRRLGGFALWFLNYSTWMGTHGLYLEDLYVRPELRGSRLRHARSCRRSPGSAWSATTGRLEWWVLDWNEPALGFYRQIGAVPMDEWTVHRVTGDALLQLAAHHPGRRRRSAPRYGCGTSVRRPRSVSASPAPRPGWCSCAPRATACCARLTSTSTGSRTCAWPSTRSRRCSSRSRSTTARSPAPSRRTTTAGSTSRLRARTTDRHAPRHRDVRVGGPHCARRRGHRHRRRPRRHRRAADSRAAQVTA